LTRICKTGTLNEHKFYSVTNVTPAVISPGVNIVFIINKLQSGWGMRNCRGFWLGRPIAG